MVWLPWSNMVLYSAMSSTNADLIAVSPAWPKDPKSPYRMGPSRVSSVRNLLEKVGDLRDIAILVQSNLAFLIFTDLCLHGQTVSDYHPLFYIIWVFFFQLKLIFDYYFLDSWNISRILIIVLVWKFKSKVHTIRSFPFKQAETDSNFFLATWDDQKTLKNQGS